MHPSADRANQRRARGSCDLCKRMKIRCDKISEKCSQCQARGIPCNVSRTEPRKPRIKKTADQINFIENRIKRMESLLQSSGIVVHSPPERPKIFPSQTTEGRTAPAQIDGLSNLVVNDRGGGKYIGPSSGFSLFSPRGLDWVQRKTGSNQLNGVIDKLATQAQLFSQSGIVQQLNNGGFTSHKVPPKSVTLPLVSHYFNSFNAAFPLFDQNTFLNHLDRHYSDEPPTSKSWYGALNIVLSIGCITATDSMQFDMPIDGPSSRDDFLELSRGFFQNTANVLTDLLFVNNELMGVQTIIGMAFIVQALLNPEASYVLISIAVTMAHAMGLHCWLSRFQLSQPELEQRRSTFWIICIFEKSICIRIGRPSAINEDDIGVPLPPDPLNDEGGMQINVSSAPDRKFYPFRAACVISLIESRVYNELYSAKSGMKDPVKRLQSVIRLDEELQEWKDSIPVELRPEHTIQCEREHRFPILMLHFTYYNCLTAIHRISVHHGSWTSRDSDRGTDEISLPPSSATPATSPSSTTSIPPPNARVYTSYALCLSAARSIIHLATQFLDLEDDPRNCLIWIAIYFPMAACMTLFAHALQSPRDPRVSTDLELMERSLTCLSLSVQIGGKRPASLTFNVFSDLVVIARDYVESQLVDRNSPVSEHSTPIPLPQESFTPQQQAPSSDYPHTFSLSSPGIISQELSYHSDNGQGQITHPTTGVPPYSDWPGCFNNSVPPPFDITDPDHNFLIAPGWNQLGIPCAMDVDWEVWGAD